MTEIITRKEDRKNPETTGRWKQKVYSQQLADYVNQAVKPDEKNIYMAFFNSIREESNICKPHDLMMLDVACYDFIRIKRLQKIVSEQGDCNTYTTKKGNTLTKANEASYLLNAVSSQFRQSMKELMLTRKEEVKKSIGLGQKDFANWMNELTIDAEVQDGDRQDAKTSGTARTTVSTKT